MGGGGGIRLEKGRRGGFTCIEMDRWRDVDRVLSVRLVIWCVCGTSSCSIYWLGVLNCASRIEGGVFGVDYLVV